MTEKIAIIKRIIDCICLIHNELEFKSIVPHPQFQQKKMSVDLMDLELRLLSIIEEINMFIEWEKIEYVKEIFKYIINKIINQEKEGIKLLKEDEFSFHLILYRCFGLLINYFCFNFAVRNDCSLINSINYFKLNFFSSKDEMETLVEKIIYDYFKFFGFLAGCKNNYFNYYERLNNYPYIYFNDKRSLIVDFSLLKYLFALTEKKNFDINIFLKLSNIENIYYLFDKIFITNDITSDNEDENKMIIEEELDDPNNTNNNNLNDNNISNIISDNIRVFIGNNIAAQTQQFNTLFRNNAFFNRLNKDKSDENNCIMEISFLFNLIITFMKDDSSPYWSLMRYYEETISSETKKELFDYIKKNEYAKKDLENILKEKIIHEIISKQNLINLKKLKKNIDNYLLIFFDENSFNKILDELTLNKIDGETKIFYVKDSCLNYLDMNYYISPKDKSNAHRYILEFKKDKIKTYNNYYFNPSKLTYDIFNITYEKILLDKNNLELIIKIIEKLSSNKKNKIEDIDMKYIRNTLLPIILNYLSIFSMINTKSFIQFKIENKESIDYLLKIFSDFIKNNKSEEIIEKDLKEYIKEIIKELTYYEIIYNDINFDLSKLNNYDYNAEYIKNLNMRIDNINENDIKQFKLKKANSNQIKEKFKKIMKKK